MAAVAATLNMTAESSGATTLDRRRRTPPRNGQRRAMAIAKSWAEAAEHIRHFQPLTDTAAPSGGHEVRQGWRHRLQRVQMNGGGADLAGGDAQIL